MVNGLFLWYISLSVYMCFSLASVTNGVGVVKLC